MLTDRESINEELQTIIDQQTDPWGVKVSAVEVKDVEIPQGMQRSMAGQAEAERERRVGMIFPRRGEPGPPWPPDAPRRLHSPTPLVGCPLHQLENGRGQHLTSLM